MKTLNEHAALLPQVTSKFQYTIESIRNSTIDIV
jgi:hypothetical protein